jgi:hypothetical protein
MKASNASELLDVPLTLALFAGQFVMAVPMG